MIISKAKSKPGVNQTMSFSVSNPPPPPPPQPKRGEVWLVNIPNQPNDPHQPRTAIIISPNGRNRGCNDVIAVPTSSAIKHPNAFTHVHIPKGEGGLYKDSYAKCDQVTTVDKSLLAGGPLGTPVHVSYLFKIEAGIKAAIGC